MVLTFTAQFGVISRCTDAASMIWAYRGQPRRKTRGTSEQAAFPLREGLKAPLATLRLVVWSLPHGFAAPFD